MVAKITTLYRVRRSSSTQLATAATQGFDSIRRESHTTVGMPVDTLSAHSVHLIAARRNSEHEQHIRRR